jgi:uncharacterized membrane protein
MTPLVPLILLAVALRLLGALLRPVWVDEAASAIFTAGNSSWITPQNSLVSLSDFVASLRLVEPGQLLQALGHLHREDNHPPLHFALAFVTGQLLQEPGAVLQPLTARLPAVLCGSLAVPLLHRAVLAASGERRAASLAAAAMAVSPLAVAMGLEARHYALATTLVCAALWALAAGWRHQQEGRPLPWRLPAGWLALNLLGLFSHHLFVLCIAAQLITVVGLASLGQRRLSWPGRLALAPGLSLLLAGAWLALQGAGGAADQTAWLALDPRQPLQWLLMPVQLLVTALCAVLAPGTSVAHLWQWPFVIAAGAATLLGLLALGTIVWRAGRPTPLLLVFSISSLALLLGASLISGKDFSRALRYGFVFVPGVLGLLAVAASQVQGRGRGRAVSVLLGSSLVCCLAVAAGVALPASYNPELLVQEIQMQSREPIVLVFQERPVPDGQPLIGYEGLSIAWHLQSHPEQLRQLSRGGAQPRLMLLRSDGSGPAEGIQQIERLQGPFDLWIINAHGTASLTLQRSDCRHLRYASGGGHLHDHYRCSP